MCLSVAVAVDSCGLPFDTPRPASPAAAAAVAIIILVDLLSLRPDDLAATADVEDEPAGWSETVDRRHLVSIIAYIIVSDCLLYTSPSPRD